MPLELLPLKAGADPNAPFTLGLGLLVSRTPLSWAAENCHTETVAALLKAGADPKGLGRVASACSS